MPTHTKTCLVLSLIFLGAVIVLCVSDSFLPRDHDRISYRAKADMTAIIVGLKQYQTEYNHLPTEAFGEAPEEVSQPTRGAILNALMAKDPKINPQNISFYDPPIAKDKKAGLYYDEHNSPVMVDIWGTSYYLILDVNGDGTVPNPDPRDNKKNPFLETTTIMFSAGPDRDPNTWNDNIASWK
jgi:hypothetical protein